MNELKYCKFCDKEKPIKDFVKSGFAIKNICRECQNKKQTQIYKNSKEVEKLEQENKKLNGVIQTYDILLKANVEENKQLKDNWNKLKKYINEANEDLYWTNNYDDILYVMQELEGSDSNV